ncbi:MAG: hypothetical protein E7231_00360 [Cellulosilyticum sp.]|nr:hypothetical protein [Cellulosilyticum sp.]
MNEKEKAAQRIGMFLETFFTGILLSNCTLGVKKNFDFVIIDNETRCSKTITQGEMLNMLEEFKTKTWDKT